MMTNYKTKKAEGNPLIALWPENLGKKQNVFFSNFVLLKREQELGFRSGKRALVN